MRVCRQFRVLARLFYIQFIALLQWVILLMHPPFSPCNHSNSDDGFRRRVDTDMFKVIISVYYA